MTNTKAEQLITDQLIIDKPDSEQSNTDQSSITQPSITTELKKELSAADNLVVFNSESVARDLNARLQEMENELHKLGEHLDSSHHDLQQGFERILSDVKENVQLETREVLTETKDTRKKLGYLENSYQSLETKSATLAKETARLTLLLDKSSQQHEDSVNSLEKSSTENFKQLSQELESLDQQVIQLVADYKILAKESESLIKDALVKTFNLEQTFSEHESDFKKLAQEVASHNKQVDSRLEQVGHNFSFHDAKIMKLHEKEIDLESQNQTLTAQHNGLAERTEQVESRTEQVESRTEQVESRTEQLKSVDEELHLHAQRLKETTERLNEDSQVLETTTVSLQEQSHDLQGAVSRLNEQNERLDNKTDELGLQIVSNAQSERHHFQYMTMALSIVAIVTVIGLIYSFINQQSLWQSSMDNDVAVERRINLELSEHQTQLKLAAQNRKHLTEKLSEHQTQLKLAVQNREQLTEKLSEHKTQLMQAAQNRKQLTEKMTVLQEQVKTEQEKVDNLVKASEEKSKKIVQLKGELNDIDENIQYLNSTVGPLRDYSRLTGKQGLHNEKWLAQQPDDYYAIQLISVDSQQKMYQFIEQNGYSFSEDLAYFSINSEGRDYYILTYGSFKELVQARTALSELSWAVAEQSPGIARLADIQTFLH